jgi:hypothetical protein
MYLNLKNVAYIKYMMLEEALEVVNEAGYKLVPDVLTVEANVLKSLDKLDLLLEKYLKSRSLFEMTTRRSLLKDIEQETHEVIFNINLLNRIHRGHATKFFKDALSKSNDNVVSMAKKIVDISVKIKKVQNKTRSLDLPWKRLIQELWNQDYFTIDYNRHSTTKLKSITTEIEIYAKSKGISTDFLELPTGDVLRD